MGLYDGHGRLAKPLDALRAAFKNKTRMQVSASSFEMTPGGRQWLALTEEGRTQLFRPEDDDAKGLA
jgi:hypothetical protein